MIQVPKKVAPHRNHHYPSLINMSSSSSGNPAQMFQFHTLLIYIIDQYQAKVQDHEMNYLQVTHICNYLCFRKMAGDEVHKILAQAETFFSPSGVTWDVTAPGTVTRLILKRKIWLKQKAIPSMNSFSFGSTLVLLTTVRQQTLLVCLTIHPA